MDRRVLIALSVLLTSIAIIAVSASQLSRARNEQRDLERLRAEVTDLQRRVDDLRRKVDLSKAADAAAPDAAAD